MELTKTCKTCKEEKPLTSEYFQPRKYNIDGFEGGCKSCKAKYRKEYFDNNKEKEKASRKEYTKNNKEKIYETKTAWRKKNLEHVAQVRRTYKANNKELFDKWDKEYRERHKERVLERNRQWYQDNKEYARATNKQWWQNNKEKGRLLISKRNKLIIKLPFTLTVKQWEHIKNDFSHSCAYCGMTETEHLEKHKQLLHQEHFIPLTKGGEFTHNNIIPSCRLCNISKHKREFKEWYPKYKHYDNKREKFILNYLGYKNDDTQQLSIL